MEKEKKRKRDNVGKSQNVKTVLSTGDEEDLRAAESELRDKIVLKCNHPNSSEYVHFRVEPMNTQQSLNGHFYKLVYDSDYIVHKHNPEKNHVLTHKKYENTLRQWLDNNGYNWLELYRGFRVKRPKEDARKIIQGILNAVYKLHTNGSFHGFLHRPENFAIDSDELAIGGDHKEIKQISLIHSNVERDQSICLPKDCDPQMGMKIDIQAMSRVIFDQILGGKPHKSYPPDLRHLYLMLQDVDTVSINWEFIVNHPSLWHWKSRFSYIVRVYMYYQHANPKTWSQMTTEFNLIDVKGWKLKISPNNPLGKIFQYDTYNTESACELLRYLRNAHVHFKERKKGKYTHIDVKTEGNYLDEQYIELNTTRIAELFLVDLYLRMRGLGLRFEI